MKVLTTILMAIGLPLAVITFQSCSKVTAGPYGGDVVALSNGQAKEEVLANADTGEVMIHTWDRNLKSSQPIEKKPLVICSGDQTVELQPHPTPSDPPGFCSRFYGQADWFRGGQIHHGWLSSCEARSRQGVRLEQLLEKVTEPTVRCGTKWVSIGGG